MKFSEPCYLSVRAVVDGAVAQDRAEFDARWDEWASAPHHRAGMTLLHGLLGPLYADVYGSATLTTDQAEGVLRAILDETPRWYPQPPPGDGLGGVLRAATGRRPKAKVPPAEGIFWMAVVAAWLLRNGPDDRHARLGRARQAFEEYATAKEREIAGRRTAP